MTNTTDTIRCQHCKRKMQPVRHRQYGYMCCPHCDTQTTGREEVISSPLPLSTGRFTRDPSRERPTRRNFRNPREAEELAAEWLRYFGFDDATLTQEGSDGGVDIEGGKFVAQVKAEMKPSGRARVQQLYGIAQLERKRAVFFSLCGYSPHATEWANRAGVALFSFNHAGEPEPANDAASKIYEG